MRVLFLNYEYPPLGGGAANATEYLLKEYKQNRTLFVDLVTSSPTSTRQEMWLGENICVHALPIGKNGNNLHHQSKKDLIVYSFKAYWYAKKLLKTNQYDVIHAFFGVPCGVLAMRLGKKFDVPYIVSLRGADVPGYSERFASLYNILTPLIRLVWREAFQVISNSRGLRELALTSEPGLKIPIVPNGVDTKEFPVKASDTFSGESFTVLCVSRLTPRKGIRFLIQAVALLHPRYPKLRLLIAGEGGEQEALMTQVKDLHLNQEVQFLGRVEHNELVHVYQGADVFCLPSQNEGMSNTLLEALATGLPIVATVTGGTEELVVDGENGYYVEKNNAEDIADKLTLLIEDREKCVAFGRASRLRAEAQSWRAVADAYSQVYTASVNKKL